MANNYSLYGALDADMNEIAKQVSKLFGVKLEERESVEWGDYFRSVEREKLDVSVYWNADPEDGDPFHSEFEEFDVLISIYNSTDLVGHDKALTEDESINAVLLRQRVD